MSDQVFLRKILAELEAAEIKNKANIEVIMSIKRDVIRKAVNEHASILNQKFPNVDLEEVTRSVQLMLRDSIDKNLGRRDIVWINPRKTDLIAGNRRILGRLMTKVKTDIRQTARDSINKTRTKLKKKQINTVASSFVITGTDVRNKSKGGDIKVKTDLRKGVIVKSARDFNRETKYGIQIATTFGPGIRDKDLLDLFKSDKVKEKLIGIRKNRIKRVAILKRDIKRIKDGKFGTVSVAVLEAQSTIKRRAAFSTQVKKILTKEARKSFNAAKLLEQGSKDIVDIFLGRRKKFSKGEKSRKKVQRTTTIEHPVYGTDLISTRSRDREEDKQTSFDFDSIIQIINDRLHDAIQDNMGKGNSRTTLNYRTGRFARSAEAMKLWESRERKALNAQVKYMKDPYQVFEPKGRLNPPRGRDPALIFGKAIRQILREQKIADLRRVKVTLSD